MKSQPPKDALSVALDAVNDRWSLHIVKALAFGASRYTDILRVVGAPRDVLASRLKKLAEMGIVEHLPPEAGTAGYVLTKKGRDLSQVILVLKRWGDSYGPEGVPQVHIVHHSCGQTFVAELRCQACGQPFASGDLSLADDSSTCFP